MGGTTGIAGWAKRVRTWFKDRGVYALGAVAVLVASLLFAAASDGARVIAGLSVAWMPSWVASGWFEPAATAIAFVGLAVVFMATVRRAELLSGRETPPAPLWGKRGIYAWGVAAIVVGSLLADAASTFLSESTKALLPSGAVISPAVKIAILGAISAGLFVYLTDLISRIWRQGPAYQSTKTKTGGGAIRAEAPEELRQRKHGRPA